MLVVSLKRFVEEKCFSLPLEFMKPLLSANPLLWVWSDYVLSVWNLYSWFYRFSLGLKLCDCMTPFFAEQDCELLLLLMLMQDLAEKRFFLRSSIFCFLMVPLTMLLL